MGVIRDRIEARLQEKLSPERLVVTDDSHLHAGHAGARPEGESHFTVDITARAFEGVNRLGRHRLVNEALETELAGPVHALVIKAKAPGE